ncbi:ABC transporter permease [Croceibacter atlanticus]|jgi:putative ABC transport system permease protein|uniref:ABC transporter efflux protein n=1 Tax=Croceibacter atlanticus (strain ATCC BAA-628 / JCM 21780 / CIP 108009 / IAM 15332 / KCTC 12090 / HTCC2559) TaxID=216432 RepID=A3U9E7_CROAH|nr:ABC transporter permease [Croceibacter atlanticus]EAP86433.1 ABC transporter efflux protein [Croceibacter atlanticus HTCC2559]MBW4971090.1 ABC transporter permease [Croceibacter atlanticus]WSP34112.1 ABC transporter permease [Croceibacter atlanticus]HAT70965.1 ABC transporter permease [Flavobacteriaceae bacterium]|tara:strand:+ start:1212 stop:2456 length:1245 start_codon:yes stop_codon:yes gene_type:complete
MFGLFKENVRIAFDSIKSQLLRTILTVMIIAIGITALVGILSAVSALENTISGDFSAMGANTFNIRQYEFNIQMGGRPGERQKVNPILSYNEVKEFKEKFEYPFSQTSISFTGTASAEVRFETEKTDPEVRVLGVNEYFLDNSGLKLEKGRNFTVFDIENNNNVCILGADFYEVLFKDINPIDKTISIRGVKFKVIGILEEKGSTFGNNQDLRVLIPIQNARSIFTAPNINYEMSVKIDNKEMMEGAQDEATITFRNIRGLSPVQDNNFGIERSDSLLNQIFAITGYLDIAAWIISIITIFGSSIALMNIMLVSVTERTREIGVRKALGAKRNTIATQFFMETLIIGQLGGLIGIILGILIGYAVASAAEFDFVTPWVAILWATGITFLIAVVSGSYPALKASKQDPIESLRYE